MNFSDLYFQANKQFFLNDLVPLDKDFFAEMNRSHWEEPYSLMSFEKWKEELESNGYDVNRIRRSSHPEGLRQFFYVGEYWTVELQILDPSWLTTEFGLGYLRADELGRELLEQKNYTMYFFSENNLFAIDYFHKHVDKIAPEDRYEAFKSMYIHCNYGFDAFDQALLKQVFSLNENNEAIKELHELSEEGYITVYRGEGARSTGIESAYSWTLSRDVARRFAHHFERGRVYKAKVHLNDAIDYIDERNEKEVWVRYSDLVDVELIEGE